MLGISPRHTTPDRMLETMRAAAPKMARILAAIGLKPE